MSSNRKITIDYIAKKADVSIATVSRIINNKGTVKESTRQRVLRVMEEFNFQPKTGDILPIKKGNTILICVPDFTNPFNAPVIDGVQRSAYQYGYNVILLQTKEYTNFEEVLQNTSIAGVIILTTNTNSSLIDNISFRCPVVLCSEINENYDVSSVIINDFAAAKKATEYLISCGRKKIAMINSPLLFKYAQYREEGFRQAMQNSGLAINECWIIHLSTISYNLTMSNAMHLFNQTDRPDAVFAVSDVYAVGAIQAAKNLGLRVPEDIAVVGFDNIEISMISDPTITTISQPSFEIGFQASELLIEKINNPNAPSKHIILDTELIVRDSTPLNT